MVFINVRAVCVLQLFIWCIDALDPDIAPEHIPINPDAITFPKADNTLLHLPFLHGINLNTKDKVQLTKTPIQSSSEAFALDLIRVSESNHSFIHSIIHLFFREKVQLKSSCFNLLISGSRSRQS